MQKNYNKNIMDWTKKDLPEYDMLWTDPPWQPNMVAWFQNKLKKDTGEINTNTLFEIIDKLGELADIKKPLLISYSSLGNDFIINTIVDRGHTYIKTVKCIQKNKEPMVVLVFNVDIEINTSVIGLKIVTETLRNTNYNVILDLFAGVGFTADAVRKAGKTFIGSELNRKRYEKFCKVNHD